MATKLKVLMVEDRAADAELELHELRRAGFEPEWKRIETEADFQAEIEGRWDLVLIDYNLPQFDGVRALEIARERQLDAPLIIVSGTIGEDVAVAAMKAGANDYVMKDRLARLGPTVERELREAVRRREHRLAEEALRQSEARFRQVAENISEAFWVRDRRSGRILYVSPAYETIWGRPADEAYRNKMSFMESVHPEDKERVSAAREALYEEARPFDETYRVVRPDGTVRWVRARDYPVIGPDGTAVRHVGIAEDITERKQAEDSLARSESRFRALIENSHDAITLLQADGTVLFDSPSISRVLGYGPAERIGRKVFEFVLPEDREGMALGFAAFAAQPGATAVSELLFLHKDGTQRWIEGVRTNLLDEPAVRAIVVNYRDITERKRAELALSASEARLSNALQMARAGHWEYDVDRDLFTFNDNFFRIFRTTAAEAGGYGMSSAEYARKFCHPDDLWMVAEETRAAIASEDPNYSRQIEHRFLYPDGEVGWIAVRFFITKDARGRTVKTYGVNQDITERKRTEDRLRVTLGSLRSALGGIIQVLSTTTEKRDPYTAGHQKRVADLAEAVGLRMGLPLERVEGLRLAGTIHDIGKVAVPAEILSKPSRLTETEYKLIQIHPQVGYDIVKDVDFSWPIAEMILQHHERLDGSGYPRGLKGGEILLEASILAVSDVIEAMASFRPYRAALGIGPALEEIERNSGIRYDPDVAAACLALFKEKKFAFS